MAIEPAPGAPVPAPRKGRTWLQVGGIGCGALILGCICLSVAGSLLGSSSSRSTTSNKAETPTTKVQAASTTTPTRSSEPSPTERPPPTRTPSATSTPQPTVVPVLPYEIVNSERTSTPGRLRYRASIIIPEEYDREQAVAVLADAVRKTLQAEVGVRAVVVFAYTSADTVNGPFNRGRAVASSDRRGWAGDGSFRGFGGDHDEGKIYGELGSSFGTKETFEVER